MAAYPKIRIAKPLLALDRDEKALAHTLSTLHDRSRFLDELVDVEIDRIRGYYQAFSDWFHQARQANQLAAHIGLEEEEYKSILKDQGHMSAKVLAKVTKKAWSKGYNDEEIAKIIDIPPQNIIQMAKQRMEMLQTVFHSTPVIIRDPFDGRKMKTKAEFEGVKFSAMASPRIHNESGHGYVFRFAVCNTPLSNFRDNNPAMILDAKAVDTLDSYDGKDKLYSLMAKNLTPNVHDWSHSWLLYDVNASSQNFMQWGNDIFFQVGHMSSNELVINYEMLSMTLHRYTWKTMFEASPELKPGLIKNLSAYLDEADKVKAHIGGEEGQKLADYLAYVVFSNLLFVLDPKEPEVATQLARYPYVEERMLDTSTDQKIGYAINMLHSDLTDIPSQHNAVGKEAIVEYVARYPLGEEVQQALRKQRLKDKSGEYVYIGERRIYKENLDEYEKLPLSISNQIRNVADSGTYKILNEAIAAVPDDLRGDFIRRTELDEDGRVFFRIEREEINLANTNIRTQDKKVLLVRVPEGQEVELHPRSQRNLVSVVKRQKTIVKHGHLLAFNTSEEGVAYQILNAGKQADGSVNFSAMIKKANELAALGHKGADDIYPVGVAKAEELYQFKEDGFYQSLGRVRYASAGVGPLVMNLQYGEDQKLFDGAIVYIPKDGKKSREQNPDIHFMEKDTLVATHREKQGLRSLRPITFHRESTLSNSQPVHRYLKALAEINLQIDTGRSAQQFTQMGMK